MRTSVNKGRWSCVGMRVLNGRGAEESAERRVGRGDTVGNFRANDTDRSLSLNMELNDMKKGKEKRDIRS